ncbi:Asparagine synthetase [glutamine-hydrolyzing], partial [Tetrabaena socialis]
MRSREKPAELSSRHRRPAPQAATHSAGPPGKRFSCLSNATALAEAFAPLPERQPSPPGGALSGAELIAHMYAKVGVELLGLLRGAFTFVLYESKTSRVLAARDGAGGCPLWQARGGASGSLVLSCARGLLEAAGCGEVVELMP